MSSAPPVVPPLAVALPMLNLVPGGMGGTETYTRELLNQFAQRPDVAATAFVPANARGFALNSAEVVIPSIRTGLEMTKRLSTLARAALGGRGIRRLYASADVVHYPFTAPLPGPRRRQAWVTTLHDVQHLELPHLFTKADLAYRRHYYEGAARRADAVITVSEFAKRSLVEHVGIAPERVHVSHLGVDLKKFQPHLGQRENFLLYPARGWAHKNHRTLIEAVALLRTTDPSLTLVLTGGNLDSLGPLPEWVDRRGLVSDQELQQLYRSAAALVFPSLYEGFGLPPLEAMASGCPVAASNAGSIPEVVGDAAVLFDATDARSIATGVADALARASELATAGLARAATFTWERCAEQHLAVYRSVVGGAFGQ
jgi:glycosyltransferase involved in cell wall biosynthesis